MNISYKWLKKYIDVKENAQEVADRLTSLGLEVDAVEEIQTIKGGLEGLVIGEVLTCVNHPNSDHLHITTVNLGDGNPTQIVCGAPNVAAGQKVVVATLGTKLYDGDNEFVIKKSKIRGEESFGMICAEDEIGLGTSHDGIIVLPNDAVPGTLAKDYYHIENDTLIEVDITPNRVDGASHLGVARDLAASYRANGENIEVKWPSVDDFKVDNTNLKVNVSVENTEACPRYTGVTISGVTIKESPEWLQNCLRSIGVRPINNVVDVTNFILNEIGQPLHSFDADKLKGNIIVKTLPEGTKFTTLDEVERTLSDKDLMICNQDGGMCIAGVFGGIDSGITESTKNVFLESAYFNPVWVRKTARRHGLSTDASFHYERGCDPNICVYALKRAAMLIKEVAGGEISSEITDIYPNPIPDFYVDLTYSKTNSLIGKELSKETIKNILAGLEVKILEENGDNLKLQVPAYRVDVQRDVDVIEDILRVYGYNNVIPGTSVKTSISYSTKPNAYELQSLISEQLVGAGFNEIMNNSLTKVSFCDMQTTYPIENAVKLLNPLSQDLGVLRQTLLFGGLENIAFNRNRKNANLRLFEFGNCYRYNEAKKREDDGLSPYFEDFHLGIFLSGNNTDSNWFEPTRKMSFYDLKATVLNILKRLGATNYVVKENNDDVYAQALQYESRVSKKVLAVISVVSPKLLKKLDIDGEVFYADLNWNNIVKEVKNAKVKFEEISKFPEVKRDLALLIDKKTTFAELEQIAYETERRLLKDVFLFDVYEGKNLGADKKSYAVSFILQDKEKTLTDNQIDSIMNKLIKAYETKLGASVR